MPDLTQQTAYTCASNVYWRTTVQSLAPPAFGETKPKTYTVEYFDGAWRCSCKDFEHRGHIRPCKHILGEQSHRCGWGFEAFAGGQPQPDFDSSTDPAIGRCPDCGEPVRVIICAV